MIRPSALIPLILLIAAPGVAAAQISIPSLDDLIKSLAPPAEPGLKVDAPVVRPDGAPTAEDLAYERRVLDAFRAAQNRQGALDGRWNVQTLDGQVLYVLMFNDPNAGDARIDGAWANPRKTGTNASGFVDSISRQGENVVIAFSEAGTATSLRLAANSAGAWRGESEIGGAKTPVVMMRAQGIETMALGQ